MVLRLRRPLAVVALVFLGLEAMLLEQRQEPLVQMVELRVARLLQLLKQTLVVLVALALELALVPPWLEALRFLEEVEAALGATKTLQHNT